MNATQSYKILVPVQFFFKVPSPGKHPISQPLYMATEPILISRGKSSFSPHLLEPFGFYGSMLINDASALLKPILKR